MSGVAVIRYLLANNASVLAVVPAIRIYAGTLPLDTSVPAIGVSQISGAEQLTVSMLDPGRFRTDRVQVTVLATNYAQLKTLLALAEEACPDQRGVVNGVHLDSILPDGEGPDLFDAQTRILEQSRDFLVNWRKASGP